MKHILLLTVFFILSVSCSDQPQSGPVEIYYGEDICERCKMIISEKDFASQYQLTNGKTHKFDDIGCMIHFIYEHDSNISSIYVMDFASNEWIDGKDSYYVWTENIKTPMGHGIITSMDIQEAKVLAKEERGKYLGDLRAASTWIMKNKISDKD